MLARFQVFNGRLQRAQQPFLAALRCYLGRYIPYLPNLTLLVFACVRVLCMAVGTSITRGLSLQPGRSHAA